MRKNDAGSSVDNTAREIYAESSRVEVVNFAARATNDLHIDNARQLQCPKKALQKQSQVERAYHAN
jgi:hypothetical protein